MANFKSAEVTRTELVDISSKSEASNVEGKLPLFMPVKYTLVGTETANDTIQLFDLPAGCVIVPEASTVTCLDPGTTLTLDIGDALDADRYADGIVLSAGGVVNFAATAGTTMPAGIVTPYLPTATSRVIATVASAATLSANVVLYFNIAYRIKG